MSQRIPSIDKNTHPGGESGHTPGDKALESAGTHPLGTAMGAVGGAMAGAVMGIAAGPVGSLAGAVAGGIAGAAMGAGQLGGGPVEGPGVSARPTAADENARAGSAGASVRPSAEDDDDWPVANDDEDQGLPEEGFPPRRRHNNSDSAVKSQSGRDVPSIRHTGGAERSSASEPGPADALEPRPTRASPGRDRPAD